MSVGSSSARFYICKIKSNTPIPLLRLLLRPSAGAAPNTYIKSLFWPNLTQIINLSTLLKQAHVAGFDGQVESVYLLETENK